MRCINSSSHSCTPLSLPCLFQIPFFFLVHSHFSSPTHHINSFLSFLSFWCMHNSLSLWHVVISSSTLYLTVTMSSISFSFSPFSFSWTTTSSGFIMHILKYLTWRSNLIHKQDYYQSQKCHSAHQESELDSTLEKKKEKIKKKPYYIHSYFIKKITTHDWNFTLELTQY